MQLMFWAYINLLENKAMVSESPSLVLDGNRYECMKMAETQHIEAPFLAVNVKVIAIFIVYRSIPLLLEHFGLCSFTIAENQDLSE